MEIPLPGSAVSGSRCIKQIYTAPDCHKRHAACRGARHRDRAFVAVKRVRAQQADRFHNFAPSIEWKNKRKERKEFGSRERATRKPARYDGDLVARRRQVTAKTRERECGWITGRSRGCRQAGLTDKHNDLMTISYANDTKFYDRGA